MQLIQLLLLLTLLLLLLTLLLLLMLLLQLTLLKNNCSTLSQKNQPRSRGFFYVPVFSRDFLLLRCWFFCTL